jgi:glucose/arabinose dehydrogenase
MGTSKIIRIIIGPLIPVASLCFFLSSRPADVMSAVGAKTAAVAAMDIEVVADGLRIPWEIVFLPDGDMLVAERPGDIVRIGGTDGRFTVPGVEHIGEGGLLGVALHPEYARNNWVYVYLTGRMAGRLANRVERWRYDGKAFTDRAVIIDGIPAGRYHNGGRISFGPDKRLYITTGDAGHAESAQDKNSLAGKILRVKDDGGIPPDNPFGDAVWSYGHRNPQGLAWDDDGRLWSTEHGRSGILSGYDEVNLIEKGKNYGWPVIQGDETRVGMLSPSAHSGPDVTWAPAGIAYLKGRLFFAGLRGRALYAVELSDGKIKSVADLLKDRYGRLRAVAVGPEEFLYFSTSNTDGRGSRIAGDDKILRINSLIEH